VPDVNGDQALQSVLAEMATPFCERVERLCNGRGIAMFSQHNRLKADMHLLQQARTPVAFCAAMISIGNTLSDLQAERFSSSRFVLVNREEAHRLLGLAAQTSQFADAVHSALSRPGGFGSAAEE
jgi:enhancing lycopene biosynthesis protein 2